mgnify:CR=1 FL=1
MAKFWNCMSNHMHRIVSYIIHRKLLQSLCSYYHAVCISNVLDIVCCLCIYGRHYKSLGQQLIN